VHHGKIWNMFLCLTICLYIWKEDSMDMARPIRKGEIPITNFEDTGLPCARILHGMRLHARFRLQCFWLVNVSFRDMKTACLSRAQQGTGDLVLRTSDGNPGCIKLSDAPKIAHDSLGLSTRNVYCTRRSGKET